MNPTVAHLTAASKVHCQGLTPNPRKFLKERANQLGVAPGAQKALPEADPEKVFPEELASDAEQFVGDKTLADLLDEHGIKKREKGKKGGYHPNPLHEAEYAQLHNLVCDYGAWSERIQKEFREWSARQPKPPEPDEEERKREVATAQWNTILGEIQEHGLCDEPSWEWLEELDRRALLRELKRLCTRVSSTLSKTR
jgi:hypothetical protein